MSLSSLLLTKLRPTDDPACSTGREPIVLAIQKCTWISRHRKKPRGVVKLPSSPRECQWHRSGFWLGWGFALSVVPKRMVANLALPLHS